jgi:hypothetical protein
MKKTKADVILSLMTCKNKELELQNNENKLIIMKSYIFLKDVQDCINALIVSS